MRESRSHALARRVELRLCCHLRQPREDPGHPAGGRGPEERAYHAADCARPRRNRTAFQDSDSSLTRRRQRLEAELVKRHLFHEIRVAFENPLVGRSRVLGAELVLVHVHDLMAGRAGQLRGPIVCRQVDQHVVADRAAQVVRGALRVVGVFASQCDAAAHEGLTRRIEMDDDLSGQAHAKIPRVEGDTAFGGLVDRALREGTRACRGDDDELPGRGGAWRANVRWHKEHCNNEQTRAQGCPRPDGTQPSTRLPKPCPTV